MGEVVVNCATCGHASPERAKFCPACGGALAPSCEVRLSTEVRLSA
jgi:rRNA maturation endonuclease Nob1